MLYSSDLFGVFKQIIKKCHLSGLALGMILQFMQYSSQQNTIINLIANFQTQNKDILEIES